MPPILFASLLLASVVAADESQTIYRSTDDSGAVNDTSAAATVTVTVTGTNDTPSVSNVAVAFLAT